MKTSLILTLVGPDRPGLVSAVSACAGAHGANWMESRLARLAGQFAGVVRLEVEAAAAEALERALMGLGAEGLKLAVVRADAAAAAQPRLARLELVGHDRPGIVRDITRLLSELGVNLERFTTEVVPAPMSSEPLFHAEALLAVPLGLTLDALQVRLEALADDLMVELKLRPED